MFGFIGVVVIERDIEIIIIVLWLIRVISLGLFVRTRMDIEGPQYAWFSYFEHFN